MSATMLSEERTMNAAVATSPMKFVELLRQEASIEPEAPLTSPAAKTTQIIAIYGKGGIGKSFTLANLSYMMAQQGKKVLLIGCDPKSDTTSLLFGGRACPTIIETSSRKKLAGEAVQIGDVCFKRDGVYAMELGGPEVGRGCGGRGIIHGFELLEKLGFHDWGFDYVLLDFLGDVVCGGFGLPIARDMCQKVIVVASNDLQSLYVANNVCSAVEYFRKLGGNVGVAGMVINRDDGTGEAKAFAEHVGIPVLSVIPSNDDIRRKSASYEIIGRPESPWGPMFAELAANVHDSQPMRPHPMTQDALLGLFSAASVGRDVVLEPATTFDMCGKKETFKETLEVVYDEV
jgi:chlorophyllide a reductase subunit X